jgi:hypothetical protein
MSLKRFKFEIALFIIAIAGSAAIYGVMQHFHPTYISTTDWEFLKLATNIRDHGVYADNDTAALYDDPAAIHIASGYMPLYPLLILPLVHHQTLILILNWILHALLIVFTYRLSVRLGAKPLIAFIVGIFFALEPYHLVLSNEIFLKCSSLSSWYGVFRP